MSNGVPFSTPIRDPYTTLTAQVEALVKAALPLVEADGEWTTHYEAKTAGDGRWTEVSARRAIELHQQGVELRSYKRTTPKPVAA